MTTIDSIRRAVLIASAPAAAVASFGASAAPEPSAPPPAVVRALVETEPVPTDEDAADDAAIWVDRENLGRSLVIATDKKAGACVFDLSGKLVQFIPLGRVNNVDQRSIFEADGITMRHLLFFSQRDTREVLVLRIDPQTGRVVEGEQEMVRIPLGVVEPYGLAAAVDPQQRVHLLVSDDQGLAVEHVVWTPNAGKDDPDGAGFTAARYIFSGLVEGMVVLDATGEIFIGEENVGIWRLTVDLNAVRPSPGGETREIVVAQGAGTLIDRVQPEGRLAADVEGLAIHHGPWGQDILIASSQGDSTFAMYWRHSGAYIGSFTVGEGETIDAVSNTDGVAATPFWLPGFPGGLIVVQDDVNAGAVGRGPRAQNFKFLSWKDIAAPFGLR